MHLVPAYSSSSAPSTLGPHSSSVTHRVNTPALLVIRQLSSPSLITRIENLFLLRQYSQILEDSSYFQTAFCMQAEKISQTLLPTNDPNSLSPATSRLNLSASYGRSTITLPSFIRDLGAIRTAFLQNYQKKVPLTYVGFATKGCGVLTKKSNTIRFDRSHALTDVDFKEIFLPTLLALIKKLGGSYTITTFQQQIMEVDSMRQYTTQASEITIQMIPPASIHHREFYDLYLQGTDCDLTLITREIQNPIRVHKHVFNSQGGPFIQAMLNANMRESSHNQICLDHFPARTVKSFVEFIYLGSEGVIGTTESLSDLFELFKLAHMYQIPYLKDHASNLISSKATAEDLPEIKNLLNTYENPHLSQLCEYFKSQDLVSAALVSPSSLNPIEESD